MANPAIFLCDSDVLTQFFMVQEIRPLRYLKDSYGIQTVIVQEVDLEMRWLRKHEDKFAPPLEKALKGGVLRVLDPPYFQSLLSDAPVGASWAGFQSLGAQYEGHIHRGEAFTFAAGVTLNFPAVSNDYHAIKTLEANLLPLPTPVLRTFDLIALPFHNGDLELKACENVRDVLLKNGEGLPRAFMHASFADGIKNFSHRLKDGVAVDDAAVQTYSTPLHVCRI